MRKTRDFIDEAEELIKPGLIRHKFNGFGNVICPKKEPCEEFNLQEDMIGETDTRVQICHHLKEDVEAR